MTDSAMSTPDAGWSGRDTRSAIASGFARLAIGRVAAMIAQFASLVLMARALGPAEFGLVQLAVAVFVYVALLNDLGLTLLGARGGGPVGVRAGDLLGARLALTVGGLAVILIGGAFVGPDERAAQIAAVLACGFVVSSFNVRWLLQARERFGAIASVDLLAAALQLVAVAMLVRGPDDGLGAAIAVTVGPAASALISLTIARGSDLIPHFGATSIRLIGSALPLGVAMIATSIYYSADSVLLGATRSTAEVGLYAASYRIVLALLTVPVLIHSVALPVVSRVVRERPEAVGHVLSSLSSGLLLYGLPTATGIALTSPMAVSIAFGPSFEPAAVPLAILVWTCVTVAANVPFAVLLLARHQDRMYMAVTVGGSLVNVSANLVVIPRYGMIGAALTTMLSEMIVLGAILWSTRDVSGRIVSATLRQFIPPTLIMAAAVWPLRDSLVAIPVGGIAFLASGAVLGAITKQSIAEMASLATPRLKRGQSTLTADERS